MKQRKSRKSALFDLNHPADFHFFKFLFRWMDQEGWEYRILARDKELLHELLDHALIPYASRGKGRKRLLGKYLYALRVLFQLGVLALRFRPVLGLSLSSPYLALTCRILHIPCLTYDDTDLNPRLLPLIRQSSHLLSPASYPHLFHQGHVRVPSFKELAYLHPEVFAMDRAPESNLPSEKLRAPESDLPSDEDLVRPAHPGREAVFIRLTRTDSVHHSSRSRLDLARVLKRIHTLSDSYPLILSSELEVQASPSAKLTLARPLDIHTQLSACRAFWGNSATMAAEAAVLGVPAVFVSAEKFAYISELESYGLLFHFDPSELDASLEKLERLLRHPTPEVFRRARQKLLDEKSAMTPLLIEWVEKIRKSNPRG